MGGNPIQIYPKKCRGCRMCEMACSWHKQGSNNPRLALVQVIKVEEQGIDVPKFDARCDLCGGSPKCIEWCIFGALELKASVQERMAV